MPLEDFIPVIDDRRHDDIVAEIRSRIPRYTPEWTDLGETDPGITLVELFAWLAEQQVFRMGQVPQLNYLKFLELVGIELEPARPATARITFPMDPNFSQPTLIVPKLTQIASAEPDADGPILFEMEQALIAVRAPLVAVQSFNGFVFLDRTALNDATADVEAFDAFGSSIGPDAALYLGFDQELPDVSFALTFWAQRENHGVPVQSCAESGRFQTSRLAWEVWNGREYVELTVLKDDTQQLTRTGEVHMRGPKTGVMAQRIEGQIAAPLFWLRARVTRDAYQRPPALLAVRTNTGRAIQAETLEFESVGGSNGETNQTFTLGDAPVLAGSLQLQVNEGQGFEEWTEVPDLLGSGPDDAHYVLNRSTGEIRFGDGRTGRIPVGNAATPRNIRARTYQVGGGTRGNLAAGQISALQSSIRGVQTDDVANLFASAGGTDEETLDEARARAPATIKGANRAVTAEDFEVLARQAGDVARAKALPLYHPDYPTIDVPGVVTVVVVPDVDDPAPTPSEGTLNAVCALLNERRLLTTELYVTGPRYATITVTADIIATDDADLAEVKDHLLDSLALYFDARHGGEDSNPDLAPGDPDRSGGGWPFGGDVFYSLLYRRLLTRGVRRIQSLTIALDDNEYAECRDVQVPAGTLLISGDHQLDLRYEIEEGL